MELVINIDEDVRIAITRMGLLRIPDEMLKKVDKAIQRGTPLPKGHGDLIDTNEITAYIELECNGRNVESLDDFTTIVKADKAESDDGHMTADELAELFTENERTRRIRNDKRRSI